MSYPGQRQPGYGAPSGYPQPAGANPYPQGGAAPYPPGGGYPAGGAGGYPSAGGSGGYPPAGGAGAGSYPPAAGGYPPQAAGGYPPQGAGGYPPPAAGNPPQGQPAGAAPPAGSVPMYQGDAPAEDMKDDPNMQAPVPTAPPPDFIGHVAGYENVGFNAAALPPPSYDEATRGPPPERPALGNFVSITDEEARQALLQYVSEHCCYGSRAAKDMKFRELKASSAFHYILETYAEARSTCWAYEPYTGQAVDGPERGPSPGPWDIAAQPANMFIPSQLDVEVPHTATVKPCHNCFGRGYQRCYRCHGRGRLFCTSCHGTGRERFHEEGHERHRHCHWCHGSGRKMCYTCHSYGQTECTVCRARGNLKCFIKLTISWKNHKKDHIVERTNLPDHLIRGVTGQVAFQEKNIRVWPINHFPDQEINGASNALVAEHARAFPTERILMQRHSVRIVPVTQVFYSWKDKNNASFFVYGFEHKVHAPDYPQQCCCGCTVL